MMRFMPSRTWRCGGAGTVARYDVDSDPTAACFYSLPASAGIREELQVVPGAKEGLTAVSYRRSRTVSLPVFWARKRRIGLEALEARSCIRPYRPVANVEAGRLASAIWLTHRHQICRRVRRVKSDLLAPTAAVNAAAERYATCKIESILSVFHACFGRTCRVEDGKCRTLACCSAPAPISQRCRAYVGETFSPRKRLKQGRISGVGSSCALRENTRL